MLALVLLAGVALLLAGVWFGVTQPVLPVSRGRGEPHVGPALLEAHVRVLSGTFSPRDAAHPEGMAGAAAYVRAKFEGACAVVAEQPFDVGAGGPKCED